MIEFARRAFRGFFVFTLWIWFFICTIGGGILGYKLSWGSGGYAFLGVILGLFFWFCFYILGGGLLAIFLNIDENLEILVNNSFKTGTSPSVNSSGLNLSSVKPIAPTIVNSGDSWVCKKCNERNPNTSSTCKGCGTYK